MRRRSRRSYLVATAALAAVVLTSSLGAADPPEWAGEPKGGLLKKERNKVPEDRFAMAGGCYAIKAAGGYVVREGDGYKASAGSLQAAEPFHFQATDLGRYLLFGAAQEFVAASEGALGEAAYGVTKSQPGEQAGGLVLEATDQAADAIAESEANKASGRGATVIADDVPSDLADWKVAEAGPGAFVVALPETNQTLVTAEDGSLALADGETSHPFSFEMTSGCATYPEIQVNVDGPIVGGKSSFQEVRGYFDAHLHMMAFEFLGGRARCGRPWHRFGVTHALVDCPDHEPGGYGAVLEQVLTKQTPGTPHNTDGWPTFEGWPTHNSLTHEQIYYKWLERAWRGGLRMFTNLLVDNNQLCKIYPYKRNSCNEMDGVRLQAKRIHQLQDYIDAQSGGPGEGWFRIVKDPFEARRVINEGKLAVILGIEVSVPLDCGETLGTPRCDLENVPADIPGGVAGVIEKGLDEVYDLGVRQMELVNKFDNAFSGVAGDSGDTGLVVNQGNKGETGHYWKMDTCAEHTGENHIHAHDKTQHNFHDQAEDNGAPSQLTDFTSRDGLAGAIFAQAGMTGAAPIYPEGPHCNIMGLSDLGERMIRGMVERKMIFDPDHMSALAQDEALTLLEGLGYSGVVSSHSWSNDTIYPRIYKLGGVVTPYAGGSTGFAQEWAKNREWADPRFYFGFGYGADTNGFGSQGGPRGEDAENPVTYPFTGLGGVTVQQQQSGTKTYDINKHGVAHYGLYPDWIEDLRRIAGDAIVEDMARGPEAYLQMWERTIGIAGDACRIDVPDLTDADVARLQKGMSARQVIETLGQPAVRADSYFEFCASDGRTATTKFRSEALHSWSVE
ncbi:MAG TPA: hypothetical protein VJ927_10605 [Actinomycetota bacterium]|nr:hypothetical protein [Actinomycetota bacterium]